MAPVDTQPGSRDLKIFSSANNNKYSYIIYSLFLVIVPPCHHKLEKYFKMFLILLIFFLQTS